MQTVANFSDLTFIIPTRNRPAFLSCALDSIFKHFGPSPQIIIGDNGDGEATEALLRENKSFGLNIRLIKNPVGLSYIDNLNILIQAVRTPWLNLLHDDDFFASPPSKALVAALLDPAVSLIFTDHWIALSDGKIDAELTDKNTKLYQRHAIQPGRVSNMAELAVKQCICLDGFFARTEAAQKIKIDTTLVALSDNRWLIELSDFLNENGWYSPERLFAYRSHAASYTGGTIDHTINLESLVKTKIRNPQARGLLKRRIRRLWFTALKQKVKRGDLIGFLRRYPLPGVAFLKSVR